MFNGSTPDNTLISQENTWVDSDMDGVKENQCLHRHEKNLNCTTTDDQIIHTRQTVISLINCGIFYAKMHLFSQTE